MRYYVVARRRKRFFIMDSHCYVTEFSALEILLLSQFMHIVGVMRDSINPGVVQYGYIPRSYCWFIGKSSTEMIVGDAMVLQEDEFLSGNPDILLRFGIRALVSDTGELLWLHMRGQQGPFRLSQICKVIGISSLASDGVFIIDDNIQDICGVPVESSDYDIHLKIGEVTNKDLIDKMGMISGLFVCLES